MRTRWRIVLVFALLVTMGLAIGIAAGIQVLLPLMATKWIDDRWLKSLDVLTIIFSLLALTVMAVKEYRQRRR
jgi:heme/copper-type cytochrome/quinol oxidase subunit 1